MKMISLSKKIKKTKIMIFIFIFIFFKEISLQNHLQCYYHSLKINCTKRLKKNVWRWLKNKQKKLWLVKTVMTLPNPRSDFSISGDSRPIYGRQVLHIRRLILLILQRLRVFHIQQFKSHKNKSRPISDFSSSNESKSPTTVTSPNRDGRNIQG